MQKPGFFSFAPKEAEPPVTRSQAGAWERVSEALPRGGYPVKEAEPPVIRSQAGAWERDRVGCGLAEAIL